MSRAPRGFRMAFLCGARKNSSSSRSSSHTAKHENLDVAVSWPRRRPRSIIRYSVGEYRGRSHIRVIRPAAAFGRNPGNVLIRVLDIAGFAVDAVLRVDDEFRLAALLYPLIYAGRAITLGGPAIDIVLRGLFELHVGNEQMDRLIFLMIGIGEENRGKSVEGQCPVGARIGNRSALRRRLERGVVRLAVAKRAEQRKAERIGPHVETAERDAEHRAIFRP